MWSRLTGCHDVLRAWQGKIQKTILGRAALRCQNEPAPALSKNDQAAVIKVSAEFKDSGRGAGRRQEAMTPCLYIRTGWKCKSEFKFQLAGAATPAP